LKSPRLSVPQSNEKDNSNQNSSRKSAIRDIIDAQLDDVEYITRHASNAVHHNGLNDYEDIDPLHNRSKSYFSGKEEQELDEFLALEESCRDSLEPNSRLVSTIQAVLPINLRLI